MSHRVRVKFCGITRPEDARAAAELGADAIGLVFWPGSPRAVSVDRALEILDGLPPQMTVVGLFVDAGAAGVRAVLDAVPLDVLQFHGDESPEECAACGRPWIKAVRMRDGIDLPGEAARYAAAGGLLLDSWHPSLRGGTGTRFDWSAVPALPGVKVILAGGLDADNVGHAIRALRPWAVDVSGGIEREKGIKDRDRMAAFVRSVRAADGARENDRMRGLL